MTGLSSRARVIGWLAAGILGGGLLTGIAVSEFGTATAATPSPNPSASAGPYDGPGLPGHPFLRRFLDKHDGPLLGGGPGLGFGFGAGPALGGRVLHSEATVKTATGTEVVGTQSGKITDLSGSQLTVKSSDGFTRTYTVDKNTRISLEGTDGALSSLKSGESVEVSAVKSGSDWAAKSVFGGTFSLPMKPMAPPGTTESGTSDSRTTL